MSVEAPEVTDVKDITLELLRGLTPQWVELKDRFNRTAGLDSQLGGEYHGVNDTMNELLDQYFVLLGGTALGDGIAS